MTVGNATGNRRAAQTAELLRRKGEREELDQLRREVAQLRSRLGEGLPARRGRKPTRARRETYVTKRLRKLVRSKDARRFIAEAAADGLTSADLRAMLACVHERCYELMESGEMEPRFALGTAIKVVQELIKLREVEALEAAEVAGHINISVVHQSGPMLDVTPGEG